MKFKFPANNSILKLAGNLDLKFRIVFWNILIFEILRFEKQIALSERKPPLDKVNFHDGTTMNIVKICNLVIAVRLTEKLRMYGRLQCTAVI